MTAPLMRNTNDSEDIVQTLATRHPLPPLVPRTVYSSEITRQIETLDAGEGVKAALHLLNDDIQRCHNIAQSHGGISTFDYLHAVLHRREGDFWNSKWWFGRIHHPLIVQLYGETGATPGGFVDDVEMIEKMRADTVNLETLKDRQMKEMVAIAKYAIEHSL